MFMASPHWYHSLLNTAATMHSAMYANAAYFVDVDRHHEKYISTLLALTGPACPLLHVNVVMLDVIV
jgi:hypothetical protein